MSKAQPDDAHGPAVVLEDVRPGVTLLELNRPRRLNAMSYEVLDALHAAVDSLASRDGCRVVIITGRGRGFCSGADLTALPHGDATGEDWNSPQARLALQKRIVSLIFKLRALQQPVIAAVNGPATGGGLALALGADIRLAASSAAFGTAFVRVGLSGCDIGVSWLLPRLIGASRAFELMLTGRVIDAGESDRIGLVARVVPNAQLLDEALVIAEQITRNSPMGIWMTKEVMWSQLEIGSLTAGVELENRTQILTSYTQDHGEATASIIEKREPAYRNR